MPFRYVPILRSKAGEAVALAHLTAVARARIFPIVRLVQTPPATFATRMVATWAGLPMALDGLYNFATNGTLAAFNANFQALRQGGVAVIPSIECDAPQPYVTAVQRVVGNGGVVIQSTLRQLATVRVWAAAQGWQPNAVDLVIVAGHAADYALDLFVDLARNTIANHIGNPSPWRTVTFACSAAPRDYSALPVGRTLVPRLDWRVWGALSLVTPFQLDYGDYGIAHPDLTEPPGVAMVRATVSVRYTIDDEWIILKGRATTGAAGQPMARQYTSHARVLAAELQFNALAAGCWGDDRIRQIAAGTISSGSRTTWVENCVNRHLSLVAERLP